MARPAAADTSQQERTSQVVINRPSQPALGGEDALADTTAGLPRCTISPQQPRPSYSARPSNQQMHDIHPGDVVAGRYLTRAIMGRSRGLLLDATHVGLEQRVCIRVVSPAIADAKEVELFRREAETLSQLESDHVARIIDVGSLPNGSLYLVREHLQGIRLSDHARGGALTLDDALDLFLQACEAVQEVHGRGVILRDLQSKHIFVGQRRNGEPQLKLTDFGTCKIMKKGQGGGELTCTKLLGLSPSASPELVRQQTDIDERADVWSLGCLLYELLTGGAAFFGDGMSLMLAIIKDSPLPPSSLRIDIDIPDGVDAVVMRALSKKREDRYATVYALASALRGFASPRSQVVVDQIARLAGAAWGGKGDAEHTMTMVKPTPAARASNAEHWPTFVPGERTASAPQMQRPQGWRADRPLDTLTPTAAAPIPAPSFDAIAAAMPLARLSTPVAAGSIPSAYPLAHGSMPGVRPSLPQQALAAASPGFGKLGSSASVSAVCVPVVDSLAAMRQRRVAAVMGSLLVVPVTLLLMLITVRASTSTTAQGFVPEVTRAVEKQAIVELAKGASTQDSEPATPAHNRAPEAAPASEPPDADPSSKAASTDSASADAAKRHWQVAMRRARARNRDSETTSAAAKRRPGSTTGKGAKASASEPAKTAAGSIVAMAIGATCNFSVDGVSRGAHSSVRVVAAPGRHTVSCQPHGGSRRSRSVVVRPGQAAVTVFKF